MSKSSITITRSSKFKTAQQVIEELNESDRENDQLQTNKELESTKLKSKKASSLNRSIKKSQEILKKNWIIQNQIWMKRYSIALNGII